MTAEEIIRGEINSGPRSMAQLVGAIVGLGIGGINERYQDAFRITQDLIARGLIVKHDSGAFTLPNGTKFEEKEGPPNGGLRPGTNVPEHLRKLMRKT